MDFFGAGFLSAMLECHHGLIHAYPASCAASEQGG
jgi:hypothetical protein